jgi:sec-independent protein translocase protein TatA
MGEGLFQPLHLLVILVIAIFIFGPKKLPELGKSLGEGIKGFKEALNGGLSSEDAKAKDAPKQIEEKSSVEK